jgi:hypothetical protein
MPTPSLMKIHQFFQVLHEGGQMKHARDNNMSRATGWTIGILGFYSRQGLGIYLFPTASRPVLGPTQPPTQSTEGFFPGNKATGAWS